MDRAELLRLALTAIAVAGVLGVSSIHDARSESPRAECDTAECIETIDLREARGLIHVSAPDAVLHETRTHCAS